MTTLTDKVKLDDNRVGVVKFVGEIHNKAGVFYGVELAKGAGLNSGNVSSDVYFPCRRNKGLFVRENKIAKSKPEDESFPRVTYGTRLEVPGKGMGVVKYVGYPEFRNMEQVFFGVELEEPNGKNDGTVNGKFYFRTAAGHGTFLPRAKIDNCTILGDATEEAGDEDVKDADDEDTGDYAEDAAATEEAAPATDAVADADPEPEPAVEEAAEDDDEKETVACDVGDCVMVDDDKRGLVRFMGENRDTAKLGHGVWYGIRLVERRGNCNGTYKGVKYFKCEDGFGVMVRQSRITRKLNDDEIDFDFSQDDEPTEAELARQAALEEARQKKKQIRAFRAKFKEIDTDGNLTIDPAEFHAMMEEATGSTPEQSEALFYEIDITQSGQISFAEFDAWFQKQKGTTNIGADDEKMDAETAAISQALAEDIQEDVDEDVAEEIAAEDAEAEAEAEAGAVEDDGDGADDGAEDAGDEPAAEDGGDEDAE